MTDHRLLIDIARDSVLSRKFDYAYIPIGKAGNTNIKRWLWSVEAELDPSVPEPPSDYFGVHNNRWRFALDSFKGPWLGFQKTNLEAFVRELSSRFVFTAVRNPYTRLLSAYSDKVVNAPADSHERFGLDRAPRSFADFVDMVIARDVAELDIHFRPQTYSLGDGLLHLDAVARLELLSEDLSAISGKVFQNDALQLPDMKSKHQTAASQAVIDAYDPHTRDKVASFFESDFDAFGYSLDLENVMPQNGMRPFPAAVENGEDVFQLFANFVSLVNGRTLDSSEVSGLVDAIDAPGAFGEAGVLLPYYRSIVQFGLARSDLNAAIKATEKLPASVLTASRALFRRIDLVDKPT